MESDFQISIIDILPDCETFAHSLLEKTEAKYRSRRQQMPASSCPPEKFDTSSPRQSPVELLEEEIIWELDIHGLSFENCQVWDSDPFNFGGKSWRLSFGSHRIPCETQPPLLSSVSDHHHFSNSSNDVELRGFEINPRSTPFSPRKNTRSSLLIPTLPHPLCLSRSVPYPLHSLSSPQSPRPVGRVPFPLPPPPIPSTPPPSTPPPSTPPPLSFALMLSLLHPSSSSPLPLPQTNEIRLRCVLSLSPCPSSPRPLLPSLSRPCSSDWVFDPSFSSSSPAYRGFLDFLSHQQLKELLEEEEEEEGGRREWGRWDGRDEEVRFDREFPGREREGRGRGVVQVGQPFSTRPQGGWRGGGGGGLGREKGRERGWGGRLLVTCLLRSFVDPEGKLLGLDGREE